MALKSLFTGQHFLALLPTGLGLVNHRGSSGSDMQLMSPFAQMGSTEPVSQRNQMGPL